uniref:Putative conserved secreted protein n=1 Tax=Amblyomma tuberculatum TaxID=48802 RepID=A0A6M2E6N5_9ACAR
MELAWVESAWVMASAVASSLDTVLPPEDTRQASRRVLQDTVRGLAPSPVAPPTGTLALTKTTRDTATHLASRPATARASVPDNTRDPLDFRVAPLVTRPDSGSLLSERPLALVTQAWASTAKAAAASTSFLFMRRQLAPFCH